VTARAYDDDIAWRGLPYVFALARPALTNVRLWRDLAIHLINWRIRAVETRRRIGTSFDQRDCLCLRSVPTAGRYLRLNTVT